MLYALILTTVMTGTFNDYPAITQTSTSGFTSEQACINAGKKAEQQAPKDLGRYKAYALVTFQCTTLSGDPS